MVLLIICYLISPAEKLDHVPVKLKGKPKRQTLSSKRLLNPLSSISHIAIIPSLEDTAVKA